MWLSSIAYYFFYPSFFIPVIFPGLIFILIALLFTIWAERKFAAKVQMRFGPFYASKRLGGFLQLVADMIKFAFSEIIVPREVNRTLFILGPILITGFSLVPISVIPISSIPQTGSILSPYYGVFHDTYSSLSLFSAVLTPYSLALAIALTSVVSVLVILTAWVTNNRFAMISGIREGYLSVSYDALITISIIGIALEFHSLDISKIVTAGIPGIIANPLAAIVFLIGMLMGSSRFPFDITEADSELVTGPYTEYSGLLFVMTMAGSYILNFAYSLIFADVFLGGWTPLTGFPGALLTVVKAMIVLLLSVFMRSVYGRYRIDQALRGSWKYVFPAALASVVLGLVVGPWIR